MRRRSQTGPRTDTTYDIYVYMTEGKYPDGANENARRNLRKRSKMFKLKGSEVFHVSTTKDKFGKDVQRERLVLTDNAKRNAVISELHVDEKGNLLKQSWRIMKGGMRTMNIHFAQFFFDP